MLKSTYIRVVVSASFFLVLTFWVGSFPLQQISQAARQSPQSAEWHIFSSLSDAGNESRMPVTQDRSEYYTLRRDLRRCAFPMCGGYFLARVNHPQTRCFDGKSMKECYVGEIDWNGSVQIEATGALLRGRFVRRRGNRFRDLSDFRVNESWQAASGRTPTGTFYLVKDRGLRCVTHPCLTHYEAQLNGFAERNIAGVDLSDAGASESRIGAATEAMTRASGVIMAGSHIPVRGPAGRAVSLKVSQFYLPPERKVGPSTKKPCKRSGCSGQVCADADVITTCEWRPEYACYKSARCERQANGNCGFTMTPELKSCLSRAK
jgi:hypothetical protein